MDCDCRAQELTLDVEEKRSVKAHFQRGMLHDTQDAGIVVCPIDHRKLHFRYGATVNFIRLLILQRRVQQSRD